MSTNTPPPPPPPPPTQMAPPPPPPSTSPFVAETGVGHGKLSTRLIAVIAGAVVVVGGGVTAAVAGGGHQKPLPAPAPVSQPTAPTNSPTSTPPSAPTTTPPSTPPATEPSTPPETGTSTGGAPVQLANGVSLTPATGWSVVSQKDNVILVAQDSSSAALYVNVGPAQASDASSQLQADIQSAEQAGMLSDVQLGNDAGSQNLSGNFDSAVLVSFTGAIASNAGSTPVSGRFGELFSSQTGESAFMIAFASSDSDLQGATDDFNAMVNSMLGAG